MSYNVYRQQRIALEEAFVNRMCSDYNIKEVTTARQSKNGTREFEFPVGTYSGKRSWYGPWLKKSGRKVPSDRLRIAIFKSGYVRKQNGTYSPYQLNPVYKQNYQRLWCTGTKMYTQKSIGIARTLILNAMGRLVYMLNFVKRNYNLKKSPTRNGMWNDKVYKWKQ